MFHPYCKEHNDVSRKFQPTFPENLQEISLSFSLTKLMTKGEWLHGLLYLRIRRWI
jgi:hypothetical protein